LFLLKKRETPFLIIKIMKKVFKMPLFLLLAGIVFMSSCAPAYQKDLTASYKLYNQAVTAETAYRVQQLEKEMVNANSDATKTEFKAAYDAINAVIATHQADLGKDDLYGNVLALKSMSELNLEKYTDAGNSATQALTYLSSSKESQTSRDNALMTAMPGLIKAKQLSAKIPTDDKKISSGAYTNLADMAKSALTDLDAGRKTVDASNPVNEYLLMSKLAVYKNWLDIVYDTIDKDSSAAEKTEKRKREDAIMAEATKSIDALNAVVGTKKPALIKQWKALIGVD
jgi:hypothetical protein